MTAATDVSLEYVLQRSDQLARDLNRTLSFAFVLGVFGIFYLVDTGRALQQAAEFRIQFDVARWVIPMLCLFVFARMGYALGAYFNLQSLTAWDEVEPETRTALRDVSVAWAVHQTLGLQPDSRPGMVYALMTAAFLGTFAWLNALTSYLFWDAASAVSEVLGVVVSSAAALVILAFYYQFHDAFGDQTPHGTWWMGAHLTLVTALFIVLLVIGAPARWEPGIL
ncbi:MAG: hypothetical protein ACKVVT_07990 [Dehalococcoidia bacterium]